MSDQDTPDPVRSVTPYPVGDDRAVPRAGIDHGKDRDGGKDDEQPLGQPETRDGEKRPEWQHEKDRKKLSVRHGGILGSAPSTLGRASRGYQEGVLAAVPAVVLVSALATAVGWPLPLEGEAEFLMEWTPVPLANLLLSHLASFARPAALLGSLAFVMLLGGVAGMVNAYGRERSRVVGVFLAGLTMTLALLVWVPTTFKLGSALLVAAFMPSLWLAHGSGAGSDSRKAFLTRSGVVLGGAAVLVTLFSLRRVLDAVASTRLFPFHRARGLAVTGLADLVTSNDRFYRMDKVLQYPGITPTAWSLRIGGDVITPREISYQRLLGLPRINRYVTMECVDNPVGGPLIGNALWTGVALRDVFRDVGVRGDTIVFHAPDDYSEAIPWRLAEEAGAMVAYGMNGVTLPAQHGYPARVVIPGIYGFKSVKWLTGITVTENARAESWRAQGWTEQGIIHTMTRIDVVRREGAHVLVAGIAFGGRRGIRAVQVRANDGPWLEATIGPSLSRESWVQWALRFRGTGSLTVTARAVDGDGQVQDARRHGSYPNGATGWPRVRV